MPGITLALCMGFWAANATAQDIPMATADPSAPPSLALVLRPEPRLTDLAHRVASMVSRRTGEEVRVGEPPPPEVVEAVPRGHAALLRQDGSVLVVLGGREGTTYRTELTLRSIRTPAAARAVALAVETLRDTAAQVEARGDDLPAARAPGERIRTRWVLTQRAIRDEGDPWYPVSGLPPARPTIYLRTLLGYSPIQRTLLVGPGVGLGLCLGGECVVLEADLPLIPDVRRNRDDVVVRYRAVNTSVRFQWRPLGWGRWTPGLSFGVLTRIGTATMEETRRVVSNLGWRTTLELGYAFAPHFEIAAEAGVDLAISRARFILDGRSVFLEDRWTPWFVLSVRLRPGAGVEAER